MKYGFFDDKEREYVITTPETPLPWVNYLGNKDFFSLISNTCGGYSFYRDAKLMRITRYRYNSVPLDNNGKYFYIKDGDLIWNPGWQPTRTPLDSYECRHGLGYTRFNSSKNQVAANLLCFVPLEDTCEIQALRLTNHSTEKKHLKLFSYVEWCLWNALDDMTNFQRNLSTGEVEVIGSTIYHKTEYRERRNHYALYSVNEAISGFDTSREAFLGTYNGPDQPEAVRTGCCHNSVASGWYPIASHELNLTLAPGESKSLIFVLGYCETPQDDKWEMQDVINKAPARKLLARYQTDEAVAAALEELKDYWTRLLGRFQVKTQDDRFNRMVNIWNQYQCMVTFNMSRSASYYESGIGRGMGFRDSCQDLLGFVHLIPERARERILDIAATQFADGSAYHQYQPLTKQGNADIGSGFNDDPLWLIAGTSAYIRETGDISILREVVPYNNGETAMLSDHLKRSFDYTITHKGPHGLPLIGRADWNDCLNLNCFSEHPGESFQTYGPSEGPVAESVFIGGMLVKYGKEYADICRCMENAAEADRVEQEVETMKNVLLSAGWDGDWFVRAYDAAGKKVGSKECEEGQIFIEPQGFCVLAGVGVETGQARRALDSVKERLDTEYGIMLLQPAYTRYHKELGEITSYPPGYKENAGIFSHNNPWVAIAETVIGRGDRAFDIYCKTCPAYLQEKSDVHKTEPYVYSQMVAGKDAVFFGQGKNSWLTGTAAWTFVAASQHILGISPTLEGLQIDPCIPRDFGSFEVRRRYRGVEYLISVISNGSEKGVKSITVNGETISGNVIRCPDGVTQCSVVVEM